MKTLLLILLTMFATNAYAGFLDDKPSDQSNYVNTYSSYDSEQSSNYINSQRG